MAWDFGKKLEDDYGTHTRTLQWFYKYIMVLCQKKQQKNPQTNTHGATLEQTQTNSKKTHTEEHKGGIVHSLKIILPPKSSPLGSQQGQNFTICYIPTAFHAVSLGQTTERERKGLRKKLMLNIRNSKLSCSRCTCTHRGVYMCM